MKLKPFLHPEFPTWSVPIALLLLCLLSFGVFIPWLGFYWDDWPTIWYLHLFGPSGFKEVFAVDRPLLGWIFQTTAFWFGDSTAAWQLFGLITRWCSCLALWWLLRAVWPKRIHEATWTVFLFSVYPGFRQQYISVTYSSSWIILTAFFLSLASMAWAARKPRWFWPLSILSWVLAGFAMFSSEYFFGLELLRPALLWIILQPKPTSPVQRMVRARFVRIVLQWIPYLILMGVFLFWRFVLHETVRGHVQIFDRLSAGVLPAITSLGKTILKDLAQSSFIAWADTLNFSRLSSFGTLPKLISLGVILVVGTLTIIYLSRLQIRGPSEEGADRKSAQKRWGVQAVLIGIFALFVAGWPFWATRFTIDLRFPWDRFTLAMMLGTSLLFAGLVTLLARNLLSKVLILGVAVGLAAGLHVQIGNQYRLEWNSQKMFFWELSWRAPGIQPGTTLLTSELPFVTFSDNSLTAPLNWVYAPDNRSNRMPYMLYAVETRLGLGLQEIQAGLPIHQNYRATYFTGSTSDALVVYYNPPGCVKVLNPALHSTLPQKPQLLAKVMALSNPQRVIANAVPAARPPQDIFGPEPAHNWCYYFEKADLAAQIGDWDQVVQYGEQAFQLNERLYEVNAPELIPYIEGNAQLGNWKEAKALSVEAHRLTFRMRGMLCYTWDRIARTTFQDTEQQAAVLEMQERFKCRQP